MTSAVLTVTDVVKKFSGTMALKGITLELYKNEILALVGENGAGKSTLMKILSGVYPYGTYEGKIERDGKECRFSGPADSEHAGIAMIYQELNLELDLTVGENIMLGSYPTTKLGTIDWKQLYKGADEILAMLCTNIDSHAMVRSLNTSMQEIVSIARALQRKPKVLILDEPTSVLTEKETEELMRILKGLKEQGISCIYISHKLDEIYKLCDRIAVLRDGYKINEYVKEDGYRSEEIIEDMIGRHLDVMYPTRQAKIGEPIMQVNHFKVPHPSAFGKYIIEDVSFTLRKGEILGFSGLVGAGRSELINAIFGTIEKTSGTIELYGKEVEINSPAQAIGLGLGLLSEDRKKDGFIPAMTIRENITLVKLRELCNHMMISPQKEKEAAEQYYAKLRIKAPSIETVITNLSGGNQQKVILAKWLLSKVKILMLDEPTRGIDVGTKAQIYKLMQELTDEGISLIMISSEMPELLAMCDRIIVLGKGIVQSEFARGEADEKKLMRAASCT